MGILAVSSEDSRQSTNCLCLWTWPSRMAPHALWDLRCFGNISTCYCASATKDSQSWRQHGYGIQWWYCYRRGNGRGHGATTWNFSMVTRSRLKDARPQMWLLEVRDQIPWSYHPKVSNLISKPLPNSETGIFPATRPSFWDLQQTIDSIPWHAKLVAPLHAITGTGTPFFWGEDQQQLFNGS